MFDRMRVFATALLAASSLSAPVSATGILLGYGAVRQTTDLAPYSDLLENGVDRQNVLGGIGSGLAWAGGNTFLAAPDRGPNATSYAAGAQVDQTTSFIERFETFQMTLTPGGSGTIPFTVTPTLTGTTLLSSATALNYGAGGNGLPAGNVVNTGAPPNTYYYTGRSDNFAAGSSQVQNNARLDIEGIRVSADGKSVFVSDEYGPYLDQFDRSTGRLIKSFTLPGYNNALLPGNLYVPAVSAVGADEDKGGSLKNTTGRVQNKGMEGLAITPDGKTLVGIIQASLLQDGSSKLLRIVTVDIATGATHEYGYRLTTGSGVSEIVALNDHQFLVDERDGTGVGGNSGTPVKNFYLIDLQGATDITTMTASTAPVVGKTLVTDFAALLAAAGLPVPSKIEGLAFGSDITVNGTVEHTLWVANDNDFTPADSGPSQFYVVGYTDADFTSLDATFQAQSINPVPEPSSLALIVPVVGAAALLSRKQRQKRRASRGDMTSTSDERPAAAR